MGMRQLEAAILAELKDVSGKSKIRQKDIMEWQSGQGLKPEEGETLYWLPRLGVSVAVKLPEKQTP